MNEEMNNGGSVEKTPFYKKNWFVILLIIFIPPAGLIMMWVNKQFGKTARIVLTIVLAILPNLAAPAVCEDDGPIIIGPKTSNIPMLAIVFILSCVKI